MIRGHILGELLGAPEDAAIDFGRMPFANALVLAPKPGVYESTLEAYDFFFDCPRHRLSKVSKQRSDAQAPWLGASEAFFYGGLKTRVDHGFSTALGWLCGRVAGLAECAT
jgi:hypothetical protein